MNPLDQMREAFAQTAAQLAGQLAAHDGDCLRCQAAPIRGGSRARCATGKRLSRAHDSAKRNAEVAQVQLKLGGAS